jgi:hypothetical protein
MKALKARRLAYEKGKPWKKYSEIKLHKLIITRETGSGKLGRIVRE